MQIKLRKKRKYWLKKVLKKKNNWDLGKANDVCYKQRGICNFFNAIKNPVRILTGLYNYLNTICIYKINELHLQQSPFFGDQKERMFYQGLLNI